MAQILAKETARNKFNTSTVLNYLIQEPTLVLAVFLMALMWFLNPYFLTIHNLLNVLRVSSIIGLVTCGVSWMLISGSFDLSVGSIVSLCSVLMMMQLSAGTDPLIVILTGLAAGVVLGLVNGLLIGWIRANAMVVTLGTMAIYQGLAFLISGGEFHDIPRDSGFLVIGNGSVSGLAVPSIIFLGVAFIMHVILSQTTFGRRVFAIGGNERAARLLGLPVARTRVVLFVVTGVTSAIAAMVVSARAGGGNAYFFGRGFEFDAITAAVFGGVYLFGGHGSVFRGVLGAVLLSLLANAQTILGVPVNTQMIVEGLILVVIVGIQVWAASRGRLT